MYKPLAPPIIEPAYVVGGFTDGNYFSSAAAPVAWGSLRVILRVNAIPGVGVTGVICAATTLAANNGWSFNFNSNGFSPWVFDAVGGITFAPTFLPSVARLYVEHITCTAGAGGQLIAYTNGPANGVPTAMTGGRVAPAGNLYVGRSVFPTFPNTFCDVVSVCQSASVMTPAQVADDAAAIMAYTSRIVQPGLPGETLRYVARDLAGVGATDWHDRDGDNFTLARTGAPVVALLT